MTRRAEAASLRRAGREAAPGRSLGVAPEAADRFSVGDRSEAAADRSRAAAEDRSEAAAEDRSRAAGEHRSDAAAKDRSGAAPKDRSRAADGAEAANLWAALREVRDPELPISLVDLGIVYGIRREGGRVEVELTFTATACPCMGFIQEDVRERLLREPGVAAVEIRVVWDPPWTRDRMTDEGRRLLKEYGVAA